MLTTDPDKRKKLPIVTGVLDLFPDAIQAISNLSYEYCEKADDWKSVSTDEHANCLVRHIMDRGCHDEDGFLHDVKVAWRALALLQVRLEEDLQ